MPKLAVAGLVAAALWFCSLVVEGDLGAFGPGANLRLRRREEEVLVGSAQPGRWLSASTSDAGLGKGWHASWTTVQLPTNISEDYDASCDPWSRGFRFNNTASLEAAGISFSPVATKIGAVVVGWWLLKLLLPLVFPPSFPITPGHDWRGEIPAYWTVRPPEKENREKLKRAEVLLWYHRQMMMRDPDDERRGRDYEMAFQKIFDPADEFQSASLADILPGRESFKPEKAAWFIKLRLSKPAMALGCINLPWSVRTQNIIFVGVIVQGFFDVAHTLLFRSPRFWSFYTPSWWSLTFRPEIYGMVVYSLARLVVNQRRLDMLAGEHRKARARILSRNVKLWLQGSLTTPDLLRSVVMRKGPLGVFATAHSVGGFSLAALVVWPFLPVCFLLVVGWACLGCLLYSVLRCSLRAGLAPPSPLRRGLLAEAPLAERVDSLVRERPRERRVKITVVSAKGLKNTDVIGLSDPYCVCERVDRDGNRKELFRTPHVDDDLKPVWNHSRDIRDFPVGDSLRFTVWDHDNWNSDDEMGTVCLSEEQVKEQFEGPLTLDTQGELTVRVEADSSWLTEQADMVRDEFAAFLASGWGKCATCSACGTFLAAAFAWALAVTYMSRKMSPTSASTYLCPISRLQLLTGNMESVMGFFLGTGAVVLALLVIASLVVGAAMLVYSRHLGWVRECIPSLAAEPSKKAGGHLELWFLELWLYYSRVEDEGNESEFWYE